MAQSLGSASYKLSLNDREFTAAAKRMQINTRDIKRTFREAKPETEKLSERLANLDKAIKAGLPATREREYLSKRLAKAHREAAHSTGLMGRATQAANGPLGKIAASLLATATAALSVRAAFRAVSEQMQVIDDLAKKSSALGISAQELMNVRFTGGLLGVDEAQIDKGLANLTRRISEVASGTGEAQRAFEAMGIDAKKLVTMKPSEAIGELAEGFKRLGNRSDQVRYAMDIFGRGGAGWLNVLDQGKDGLAAMAAESERVNGALSDIDAAKVEAANDAIAKAKASMASFSRIIAIEASGSLEALADTLTDAFVGGRDEINATSDSVDALSDKIASSVEWVLEWADGLVLLGKMSYSLAPATMLREGLPDFKKMLTESTLAEDFRANFERNRREAADRQRDQKTDGVGATDEEAIEKAIEFAEAVDSVTKSLEDQVYAAKNGAEAMEEYRLKQKLGVETLPDSVRALLDEKKAIEEREKQLDRLRKQDEEAKRKQEADDKKRIAQYQKEKQEAIRAKEEIMSAEDRYANRLRELAAWKQAQWIDEQEFIKLKQKAADELAQPININVATVGIEASRAGSKEAFMDLMRDRESMRATAAEAAARKAQADKIDAIDKATLGDRTAGKSAADAARDTLMDNLKNSDKLAKDQLDVLKKIEEKLGSSGVGLEVIGV